MNKVAANNVVRRDVRIARGVVASVQFLDQRATRNRVIAKCKGHDNIVVTLDRESGFFNATCGSVVTRSRRPDVSFRKMVRKTWK